MKVTKPIRVDLSARGCISRIDAVQGDTAREVEISLYSSGASWEVPFGTAVLIRFRKFDGTGGTYDTLPDGSKAYSVSGNTVRIALAPQALAVEGAVTLQVAFLHNTDVVATFPLTIQVHPDPAIGTVQSEDYTNIGEWVLPAATSAAAAAEAAAQRAEEAAGPEVIPTSNLIDDYPINIANTGINANGSPYVVSTFSCSDFIPVLNKLYVTGSFFSFTTGACAITYYDENQSHVGGYNFESSDRAASLLIELPENVKYIRVQAQNAAKVESIISEQVKAEETFAFTENLLSKYPINIQGSIGANGGVTSTDSTYFACSDFIPVLNNVYFSGVGFHFTTGANGIAFYDGKQRHVGGYNFVSNNRVGNLKIELPDNVKYIRVTIVAANVSKMECIKTEQIRVNPVEYAGNEICVFSKGLCIGDSLTEGTFDSIDEDGNVKVRIIPQYSYPTILSKLTGVELTNWGKAGRTTKNWYEWKAAEDWSGYDFAIINLGTNDKSLGEGEQATYLQNIVDKLKAENKGIKIFISTILPHYHAWSPAAYDAINDVIKAAVNANEDCYLVDLTTHARCVLRPHRQGHLTALGYHQEANDYKAIISHIISENLEDFKWVQFIGTDYSYEAN